MDAGVFRRNFDYGFQSTSNTGTGIKRLWQKNSQD
jgi:hypothetical protein